VSITVFLADDYEMVRQGLRAVLEASTDVTVVGEAAAGRDTVRQVRRLQPNVAILDDALPETGGIEVVKEIQEKVPDTGLVIVSFRPTSEEMDRALQAGARGYLSKKSSGDELRRAVRKVHAGHRYVGGPIGPSTVLRHVQPAEPVSPVASLSQRELQILQLVVDGRTSAEIGNKIHLSRKTVETYRSRLMDKLDIHDLPNLVKFAIRHGLTSL
jgi:DNA-binding NarL/FixJ family response regulator